MDRYGKLRLERLVELESYAKERWSYEMKHFSESLKGPLKTRQKMIGMSCFRVGWVVDVFGLLSVLALLALLLAPLW